ncbi:hypothetical protein C0995_006896 [Termitomyces sp. Mi166|nr:hypothetical protein C0995_006896 [Termitomyces sp. Mi166\
MAISPASSTTPQTHSSHSISHSRPKFPSVHRLLAGFGIAKPKDIKGTGVRGMLTKGDVLTYRGKASGLTGTFKESTSHLPEIIQGVKKEEPKALDGAATRRLIVSTMLSRLPQGTRGLVSLPFIPLLVVLTTTGTAIEAHVDFDYIIADYLPKNATPFKAPTPQALSTPSIDSLDGLY